MSAADAGAVATQRCASDGHVGGTGGWWPAAAWERDWGSAHPRVLCTNLRCRACGEAVRTVDDQRVPGDLRVLDARPGDDLVAALGLVAEAGHRTYACACRAASLADVRALASHEPERALDVAWSCAGHPVLALPATIDGLEITDARLEAVIDRALEGRGPAFSAPGSAPFRHPSVWLARLAVALGDRAQAARIGLRASARLDDADPQVCRAAINLFRLVPGLPGFLRLGPLLATEVARYEGVPAAMGRDLAYELRECVEHQLRLGHFPELEAGIRVDLLSGKGSPGFLFHLGRTDPGFLRAHAAALGQGRLGPDLVREALTAP